MCGKPFERRRLGRKISWKKRRAHTERTTTVKKATIYQKKQRAESGEEDNIGEGAG